MTIAAGLVGGFIIGILISPLPMHNDEEAARLMLRKIEERNQELEYSYNKAKWDYEANLTDHNLDTRNALDSELRVRKLQDWIELSKFDWKQFKDVDLKRQFTLMNKDIGAVSASDQLTKIFEDTDGKNSELNDLLDEMFEVFSKSDTSDEAKPLKSAKNHKKVMKKVSVKTNQWQNDQEINKWISESNSGKKIKEFYEEYVDLVNECARQSNFSNQAEYDLAQFESETFEEDLENLWLSIKPFFMELHAYVRGRLNKHFQNRYITKDGPIPEHILRSFDVFGHTVPYLRKHSVDVTKEMLKQGYTPLKMFEAANDFFVSLNMSAVPDSFWKNSILEDPNDDRDIICSGTAYDLTNKKDFRIIMCTKVNQIDFEGAHHEMGHIQYFMQYKDLPRIYRQGPNSGFEEAIGDVIAMSVLTPKHLKLIGLLPSDFEFDHEESINFLFHQALNRIMDLPYIYVVEKWRWSVFRGETNQENYNCHYWKLRNKYQGVQPPVDRSENHFEPGTIFQVAANEVYINYFVSAVLQFQFHKALCIAAGEYDPDKPDKNPLYNCDIYNSSAAGEKLSKMLRLGASKPWPDLLEAMTGSRKMSSEDLLEYYKPLHDWLRKENQLKGYKVGWGKSTVNSCKKS